MADPIIRAALLAATGLTLAATAAQAQQYQPVPAPVPYTQPVPWVPKAYPPMSPWMKIDPTLVWPSPPPVAPYQRAPYQPRPAP